MHITAITAYRLDLPFRDGPYICSGGLSALGFDSLVVRVDSDAGVTGWGEMAPLGASTIRPFPAARGRPSANSRRP
jgi:L-alanine-DL-glutamate epimerase-like enolase superfamily enzyme